LTELGVADGWELDGWFRINEAGPPGYPTLFGAELEREGPSPVAPTTWGGIKSLWQSK
jgi:hypothetical protein